MFFLIFFSFLCYLLIIKPENTNRLIKGIKVKTSYVCLIEKYRSNRISF